MSTKKIQDNSLVTAPLPEQIRLRTRITSYDLIVGLLMLIFIGAFFAVALLDKQGKISGGGYAQAIFLSIPAAIVLYHFLDTRALVKKGWVSLTGAGAIAFLIVFGFFHSQNLQTDKEVAKLQRELGSARNRLEKLETEKERLRSVTVMFPVEDKTGKVKQGLKRDFFYGIWIEGTVEVDAEKDEIWLVVDGVPQEKKYTAFAFHKKENNKRDLTMTLGRPAVNDQDAILPAAIRFDKNILTFR